MFTDDTIDGLLRLFPFALAILLVVGAAFAQGKQFLTPKEALELAFPKCEVARQKHVLSEAHQDEVEALCGERAPRAMVYAYEAKQNGQLVGTAWFDRHRVRSKQQLLMIVVDPQGRLSRIEVVAFEEPLDYMLREGFYEQLLGRVLSDELSTKRAIKPVAGATLTVDATLSAVRRVLATHRVVYPGQKADPADAKQGGRADGEADEGAEAVRTQGEGARGSGAKGAAGKGGDAKVDAPAQRSKPAPKVAERPRSGGGAVAVQPS